MRSMSSATRCGGGFSRCWRTASARRGPLAETIGREFAVTQAAVSQHLKVLRDNGFATSRVDGARRIYALSTDPLEEVDAWLQRFRRFWEPKLDALATEIARGKRERGEE